MLSVALIGFITEEYKMKYRNFSKENKTLMILKMKYWVITGTSTTNILVSMNFIFCLQELDVIEADGNVYKLIGPVLVKQDLEEAKQTVAKRIEYITAEM